MTSRPAASPATAGWPVLERSVLGTVLGLPGYAAIGIALGFTGLGVFIDLERVSGLGTVFKGCYFVGCVLAVCWVKRRALFGPMVQPPLLLALAVPGVVLAAGGGGANGGLAARLLAIGTPLLNGFPTMAVTTTVVVAIGIGRYLLQKPLRVPERVGERPADRAPEQVRPADQAPEQLRPADRAPNRAEPADRTRRPPRTDPSEQPTSVMPAPDLGPPAGGLSRSGPPRKSDQRRAEQRPT
ncbi:MAG: DUF6542 domain-containing protein [Pseudonocardia sp.]